MPVMTLAPTEPWLASPAPSSQHNRTIDAFASGSFALFRDRAAFDAWHETVVDRWQHTEAWLAGATTVDGYCDCCRDVVPLTVSRGVYFGPQPNLREGMVCPQGLSNRGRLLLRWVLAAAGNLDRPRPAQRALRIALFEAGTPLAHSLQARAGLELLPSEFLGPEHRSGSDVVMPSGARVRHEDITASSYADGSLDMVVHSDVLEHVPDTAAALAESYRILSRPGLVAFTAPFFVEQDQSLRLAVRHSDGQVAQLVEPPEYHGDPVRGQILTFHRFGWSLLDDLRAAGFDDAAIAIGYDAFSGLVSCNNPYRRNDNMPPLLVVGAKSERATRPACVDSTPRGEGVPPITPACTERSS